MSKWGKFERAAWKALLDGNPLVLTQKAALFVRSMRLWAKDGFRLTCRAIAERRLRICTTHPECWQKFPIGPRRCIRCGCLFPKQWILSSRCPRGFW